MSFELLSLARRADLPRNQRVVLEALCDACGEDDGTKCYPTISYLGYKTEYSRTQVKLLLRQLEEKRYIEAVAYLNGGRGRSTEYRVHIERVPMRPKWHEVKAFLVDSGELDESDSFADVQRIVRRIKRQRDAERAAAEAAQEQAK